MNTAVRRWIVAALLAFASSPTGTAGQATAPAPSGPPGVGPEERQKIEKAIPRKAPAAAAKGRKLLVIDLNIGRRGHLSIPHANLAVELMGRKTGAYEATFSSDRSMLRSKELRRFDAVFLNNTIGPIFGTPELRKGFSAFISGGGGLVTNHAATVTSQDWPELGEILGARGAAHRDADEKVTVKLDDPASPLNAMFGGKSFQFADEIFRFQAPYSRSKVHVLLSIDVARTDMNQGRPRGKCVRPDNDYPISWVHRYGKGRVFHTVLGHAPEQMRCVGFIVTYQRGTEWAATGRVTQVQVPDDFPTADKVSVRE